MTPRTPNTRPTDAEIIKMLRDIVNPPSRRDREGISRHAIRQGEALTMASALEGAEPSPLTNDMPHLVTTDDDSYTVSGVDYFFTEGC